MPRQGPVILSPDVVRYVRKAMQMSQTEFGEYLGVEKNTVYRWEAGIHLPVGRKAKEIVRRYHAAKRNEAKVASFDKGDEDDGNPGEAGGDFRGVLREVTVAGWPIG